MLPGGYPEDPCSCTKRSLRARAVSQLLPLSVQLPPFTEDVQSTVPTCNETNIRTGLSSAAAGTQNLHNCPVVSFCCSPVLCSNVDRFGPALGVVPQSPTIKTNKFPHKYFTDMYWGRCDNQCSVGPIDRFSLFNLLRQHKGNIAGYRDPNRAIPFA